MCSTQKDQNRVILELGISFDGEFFVLFVTFRCVLGGSVEVSENNILDQFIEGQIRVQMPRGAKMSLGLNEMK